MCSWRIKKQENFEHGFVTSHISSIGGSELSGKKLRHTIEETFSTYTSSGGGGGGGVTPIYRDTGDVPFLEGYFFA